MYAIFRILIGILFMFHGAQKLFGWFGRDPVSFFGTVFGVEFINEMWIAGIIEFVGGILIALGLFTVLSAALSALLMLIAYLKAHALGGLGGEEAIAAATVLLPILNRGELALLFLLSFLLVFFAGPGKYSLDAMWCCSGGKKK